MINLSESDKQCINKSIFENKPGKPVNFSFYNHIINYTRYEMEDDGIIIINSIIYYEKFIYCPGMPKKGTIEKFYPIFQWLKENNIKHTIDMQKTDDSKYNFCYSNDEMSIKGDVFNKGDIFPRIVEIGEKTYNIKIVNTGVEPAIYLERKWDICITSNYGGTVEYTIFTRLLNWLNDNRSWLIETSVQTKQSNSDIDLFNAFSNYLNAEKSKLKILSEEKDLIEKQIATLNEQLKTKSLEIEKKANDVALNSDMVDFMKKTLKINQ